MRNGCAYGLLCASFRKPRSCAHEDQYDLDDPSTWPDWLAPGGGA